MKYVTSSICFAIDMLNWWQCSLPNVSLIKGWELQKYKWQRIYILQFEVFHELILHFAGAPQTGPQSGYGGSWNWNMPQNGPPAQGGPPGPTQGPPGPQGENLLTIMFNCS